MMDSSPQPQPLPFFLPVEGGELFCLYHQPSSESAVRGAILYVPPFADEMNKCRRMAATQARAFAACGYAVLQLDLWGCGESSGDFADARWQRWLADLAAGWQWLDQHCAAPRLLWAVRLGALLAYAFAASRAAEVAGALYWQPELDGAAHLQYLRRMQKLSGMFASSEDLPVAPNCDELGGYQLAAELGAAIEQTRCVIAPAYPLSSIAFGQQMDAASDLLSHWRDSGSRVELWHIDSPPFWNASEILLVPQAITPSLQAIHGMLT